MAPGAITKPPAEVDLFKTKNAPTAYRNETWKKPVADDYMYDFKYNFDLPTHENSDYIRDFTEEEERNVYTIAKQYVEEISQVIQSKDSKAFADLFLDIGTFVSSHLRIQAQTSANINR